MGRPMTTTGPHMAEEITKDSLQIARLEERISTIDRDMRAQTEKLESMQKQLTQVLEALSEAKGGWRTLMWLGGAAATFGALVSWVLTHVRMTP